MARVDPEALEDRGLICVYIAATLADALRAEDLLSERGVDYVVQAEPLARTLFGSLRYMAAFYVAESQAQYCGAQLVAAGLGLGVLTEGGPES